MSRRIRSIKPEVLLEDERAAELSDAAWRLWVSVRTFADDFGSFRAAARYLAATVWQDTSRAKKIPAILEELASAGLIALYAFEGQTYGRIAGWDAEQRLDYRSEKTRLPCPSKVEVESLRDVAGILGQVLRGSAELSATSPKIGKAAAHARISDPDLGKDLGSGSGRDPDPARPLESSVVPIDPEPIGIVVPRAFALAYARGVTNGVGNPQAPPSSQTDTSRLVDLLDAHGLAGDTTKAIAWLETTAEEFARSADQFGRKSGFSTYAFAGWLNARGVARPGVQPAAKGARSWSERNANNQSAAGAAAKGPEHGVDR